MIQVYIYMYTFMFIYIYVYIYVYIIKLVTGQTWSTKPALQAHSHTVAESSFPPRFHQASARQRLPMAQAYPHPPLLPEPSPAVGMKMVKGPSGTWCGYKSVGHEQQAGISHSQYCKNVRSCPGWGSICFPRCWSLWSSCKKNNTRNDGRSSSVPRVLHKLHFEVVASTTTLPSSSSFQTKKNI